VPGDLNGLRLGTPEVARLGMTADDMPQLAALVARGLAADGGPATDGDPAAVAAAVTAWRGRFSGVHFTAADTADRR
jgi:glycine hydroxymethyltransferase